MHHIIIGNIGEIDECMFSNTTQTYKIYE